MKTNIPKHRTSERIRAPFILVLLTGLAVSAQAQLLYEWNFDTAVSGTTVTPAVATGGGGGLTMTYNVTATDLFGPIGSGVSGGTIANDRAFANNNTTYNVAATSGRAVSTIGDMNIGVLSQFTLTGWIRADGGFSAINGGGGATTTFQRVFMLGQGTPDTGSANSVALALFNNAPSAASQTNAFQLKLGNASGQINGPFGTDGALSGNGTLNAFGSDWTFFAVTVDLTGTANNVNFYVGNALSLNAPVTITYTNAGGAAIGSIDFGTTASALLLNRANGARGFDGLGDDFRFYNGVLDATALDAVRLEAVPEPAAVAMLGLGSLVGILALRRRQV